MYCYSSFTEEMSSCFLRLLGCMKSFLCINMYEYICMNPGINMYVSMYDYVSMNMHVCMNVYGLVCGGRLVEYCIHSFFLEVYIHMTLVVLSKGNVWMHACMHS